MEQAAMAEAKESEFDDVDAVSNQPEQEQEENPKKKQKTDTKSVEKNGQTIFNISPGKKRVSVGEYKGALLVNIREYYEKDGEELPGKTGIALSVEQFESFKKLIPDIEEAIKKQSKSTRGSKK